MPRSIAEKYPVKSLQPRSAVGFCGATDPLSPITSVVTPWRILLSALPSVSSAKSECECGSMNPGARTCRGRRSCASPHPITRPTPAMRPSRTATDPVTDGAPVPSMMRALVMRRSNGRAGRLRRDGRGAERGGRRQGEVDLFHGRIICPPESWPRSGPSSGMIAFPRPQVMFMRRPPFPLLAMALALSAVALVRAADDLVLSRFGEYLDALRVQAGIPGLAAAIVGPTDVTWEGAFGQQDVDRNIATRLDTPFQLDGTTQTIVASLAVRCASDGWLSLDDRVSKFAPTSPDAAATIGQLLTHTTAGPKGLTFSYRPDRLAPVAAAIAGCTDSSFRWGVGAFAEKMAMVDSVPGADVVQLTAPAEAFTASALQRYAGVLARWRRPTPWTAAARRRRRTSRTRSRRRPD